MNGKIKKISKKILAYILIYVGITIFFTALIIGSYLLPNSAIRENIKESVGQLKVEGTGYTPFFLGHAGAMMDNHTDALMLNIAMNKGMGEDQRTLVRAMENSYYEDETKGGISSLENNLPDSQYNNSEYSRYWHGSQVVLRTLLLKYNYVEIRYIFMFVIFLLLGITIYLISKQLGLKIVISFVITICMMYVILIPMSLQYSFIFIVTLITMIAVLVTYKYEKQKFIPVIFFITGALATYFDLLTYPLITLGMPIVLTILLENRKKTKLLDQILLSVKLGIMWTIGYGLLFFTKWVIASIILHKDAISLAINQILFRVNGSEEYPVKRIDVLKQNFDFFFVPTAKELLTIIFVIWAILFVLTKKKIKDCSIIITLICIAIVPYVWYITFAGHSSIHSWFTNKIQAMTIFAILSAMSECIQISDLKKHIKKGDK